MSFVPQSSRQRLSLRDFNFVADVFSQIHSTSREEALFLIAKDTDTLNSTLDDPLLLERILELKHPLNISADLYFYVLVRHAFRESGLDYPELADYVAATLVEYSQKNPFKTHPADSLQIESMPYHIDYIQAMNGVSSHERFFLYVRCGNQFLVLTGLFANFIKHREKRRGAPGVDYYEEVARHSYHSARCHPLADEFLLCEIYNLLVNKIKQTRRALNRMSQEYLFIG